MKIDYVERFRSQEIDIEQLRPKNSYDYLIKNRNASLEDILLDKEKLKSFLTPRNCPLCEKSDYKFKFNKDNLSIVECNNCNCVYVNPIFNKQKYFEIYKSKQYQEITKRLSENSHNYRKSRFGKERMNFIEKFHNKDLKKRFLDIGCSTGFVLEEANDRGWETVGIELNPSSVNFAKERNLNVIDRPLEEIKFDLKFSDIGLFDVIEHLINPKEILIKVHEILEENGNVYIYVPNWQSASVDLLGYENAHFIWPTHHLTYFTPHTLKFFLESNGFEVFTWETQGLDVYDWLWYLKEKTNHNTQLLNEFAENFQFYINASGHGKNLRMYARKI